MDSTVSYKTHEFIPARKKPNARLATRSFPQFKPALEHPQGNQSPEWFNVLVHQNITCNVCSQSFVERQSSTHSGERPLQCRQYNKVFIPDASRMCVTYERSRSCFIK